MYIEPIGSSVLVEDMYFGEVVTRSGIIVMDDDKNDRGIHPRWAKVYAVGPENRDDLVVGDWILIEHGRWTRAFDIKNFDKKVRKVDQKAILMKSATNPDADRQYMRGKD